MNLPQAMLDGVIGAISGALGASGISMFFSIAAGGLLGGAGSVLGDVLTGNSINAGKAIAMTVIGAVIGAATGAGVSNVSSLNKLMLGNVTSNNCAITSVASNVIGVGLKRGASWGISKAITRYIVVGFAIALLGILFSMDVGAIFDRIRRKHGE